MPTLHTPDEEAEAINALIERQCWPICVAPGALWAAALEAAQLSPSFPLVIALFKVAMLRRTKNAGGRRDVPWSPIEVGAIVSDALETAPVLRRAATDEADAARASR